MKKSGGRPVLTTLAGAIYGFVLIGAAVGVIAVNMIVSQRTQQMDALSRNMALSLRAAALQLHINGVIGRELVALRDISGVVGKQSKTLAREAIDTAVAIDRDIGWMGYVAPSGNVLMSASPPKGGTTEPANVGDQTWFKRGLLGFYADATGIAQTDARTAEAETGTGSDMPGAGAEAAHAASTGTAAGAGAAAGTGAAKTPAAGTEQVDLSTQVRDANGNVSGVLGMILRFNKVRKEIAVMAHALQVDTYVLNDDGGTIFSAAADGKPAPALNGYITHLASSGMTGLVAGDSSVARAFIAPLAPGDGNQSLPTLPWRIVVVLPEAELHPSLEALDTSVTTLLLGLFIVLALSTVIFVRTFIRPVRQLTEVATRIAEGEDLFPPERQRSRECAELSSALSRLRADH